MNVGPMNILINKYIRLLLLPFSLLYAGIMILRNKFYDWNIFPTIKIPNCKVISIGNITMGGTGKTPAVEFLAHYLIKQNKKVAILSRGYRRESDGTVIVSDGNQILENPRRSGDEPYLLAKNLSHVPIVVENDRVKGGLFIKKKFNPDYILLDDAYQHRRIFRDLNIVLFDSQQNRLNKFSLPYGHLRESLSGLKRADQIWLTKTDQAKESEIKNFISFLSKFSRAPVLKTLHQPHFFYLLSSEEEIPISAILNKKIFIFSGIGKPDSFETTIAQMKAEIKGKMIFSDHHKYTAADLFAIYKNAQRVKADWIMTTEKDAVRLIDIYDKQYPIHYLKIKLHITDGENHLKRILNV